MASIRWLPVSFPLRRRKSAAVMTTTSSRPCTVTCCGPSLCTRRTNSLKRAFASCSIQWPGGAAFSDLVLLIGTSTFGQADQNSSRCLMDQWDAHARLRRLNARCGTLGPHEPQQPPWPTQPTRRGCRADPCPASPATGQHGPARAPDRDPHLLGAAGGPAGLQTEEAGAPALCRLQHAGAAPAFLRRRTAP